jgi:hypothetical protein
MNELAFRISATVTPSVQECVLLVTILIALTRLAKPEWKVACWRACQVALEERTES